jgi:hypothetical protein
MCLLLEIVMDAERHGRAVTMARRPDEAFEMNIFVFKSPFLCLLWPFVCFRASNNPQTKELLYFISYLCFTFRIRLQTAKLCTDSGPCKRLLNFVYRWVILKTRIVSDKSFRENQNRGFMFRERFLKIVRLLGNVENMVEPERPQMTI